MSVMTQHNIKSIRTESEQWLEVARADGTHTKLLVVDPPGRPRGAVLCFPAMGVSARYYAPALQALAARGLIAASVDLRGHGECSVRPARGHDYGYQQIVEFDYPAALDKLREHAGSIPMVLLGHSLGGQLASLYLARSQVRVAGLALVASCSNYYAGWPALQRLPVLASTQLAGVIARALGYFPGRRFKFAGTESRGLIVDWSRQARTGLYRPNGADCDYEACLAQLKLPVLGISLASDFFAPTPAVDRLCAKLSNAALTRWHFQPSAQERAHYDHFRWVKSANPIVERIDGWLQDLGI